MGYATTSTPQLVPSAAPQASQDVQSLGMVAMAANSGAADFTPELNAPCPTGSASTPPDPLCSADLCNPLKGVPAWPSCLTYSMSYLVTDAQAIWSLGPVTDDKLQCAGRQFDASNNLHDGWACVAAVAADTLGNKQVSRPLRICVAAQPNSTACTASAMGGASIVSVTVPSVGSKNIVFVTESPLLGAGGAAIHAGDSVVFTGVAPAGFLIGTHTVAPTDTSGTSFAITDISPLSGGVLRSICPGVAGNSGVTTTVATTTCPALDAPVAQVAGIVVPAAKLPNCTGTVVKQADGLPAKVDATKPCVPWASYPSLEEYSPS